jgi:hypothetical protein
MNIYLVVQYRLDMNESLSTIVVPTQDQSESIVHFMD